MKRRPHFCRSRARRAFTLVEVTLSMGIVAFALVGILGTVPVAMNSARQSIVENRAAEVAATLFANFRAQYFTKIYYLDQQFDADGATPSGDNSPAPLDLSQLKTTDPAVTFYAVISDPPPAGSSGATLPQGHLGFVSTAPTAGTYYVVTLNFNNQPDGMATAAGQANRISMSISARDSPQTIYQCVGTIANRSEPLAP